MPSTVIASINYDALTTTLRITFVTGLIYDYKDVPEEVYISLKTSGAKGIYFNKHIKDKYEFAKIN